MVLALDCAGLEAALEQMSDAALPVVEVRRIEAVEELHSLRELGLAALDHEVVVVAHQAVRMALPPEPADDAVEQQQEHEAICGVEEDHPPVDAARSDVPVAVRERRAERPGHASTLRPTGGDR
jgi:hypothetical protein